VLAAAEQRGDARPEPDQPSELDEDPFDGAVTAIRQRLSGPDSDGTETLDEGGRRRWHPFSANKVLGDAGPLGPTEGPVEGGGPEQPTTAHLLQTQPAHGPEQPEADHVDQPVEGQPSGPAPASELEWNERVFTIKGSFRQPREREFRRFAIYLFLFPPSFLPFDFLRYGCLPFPHRFLQFYSSG
jgi:hypothetical protein